MYDSGIHYLQPRSMQKAQTLSESQRERAWESTFADAPLKPEAMKRVPEKALEANLVLMEEPLFYRHLQMPSYKCCRGEAVEVG